MLLIRVYAVLQYYPLKNVIKARSTKRCKLQLRICKHEYDTQYVCICIFNVVDWFQIIFKLMQPIIIVYLSFNKFSMFIIFVVIVLLLLISFRNLYVFQFLLTLLSICVISFQFRHVQLTRTVLYCCIIFLILSLITDCTSTNP